jgi:hypothetical protein
VFLTLTVSLPLTREEFDGARQADFRKALSMAAEISMDAVIIVSVVQTAVSLYRPPFLARFSELTGALHLLCVREFMNLLNGAGSARVERWESAFSRHIAWEAPSGSVD